VHSGIGSYVALQWHPEEHRVRREPKRNLRVWMSDGTDDHEDPGGSWPLQNIQMANSLKLRGYDFHFRFGEGMHANAQSAMDLPDLLAWLWRDYDPEETEQPYEMEQSERDKPLFRVRDANRDSW
jgi:enterochelin esterase family protein